MKPRTMWWEEPLDPERCHYCGIQLAVPEPPGLGWVATWDEGGQTQWELSLGARLRHRDHRTPKSRGGSNAEWNMANACDRCNMRKATKPYLAFFFREPPNVVGPTGHAFLRAIAEFKASA